MQKGQLPQPFITLSLLNMYTYKSFLPSLKTYKILLKVDLLKHQGALNLFMHAEKFRSEVVLCNRQCIKQHTLYRDQG